MGVLIIVIAIAVISTLAIKRINIGFAMIAGSVVLILLTPLSLETVITATKAALIDSETIVLVGAVLLIGLFGYILNKSGAMEAMVDSLVALVGDSRWIMALVSSLMGALTVPGGAILTAPIIGRLGDKVGIGPEYKTGVNIIFRHVWYIFLPIIPSMLTAASLAGISPKTLASLNVLPLIVGLVSAWFFLMHPLAKGTGGKWTTAGFFRFLQSIMPLLVVIFLYVTLEIHFLISLVLGIILALFNMPEKGSEPALKRIFMTGIGRIKRMILPGLRLQLPLAVVGVMIFKELLTASGHIDGFTASLIAKGIPMWLLMVLLPFFIGLATGFHEAAIAIAIPIFVPLLKPDLYLAGISLTYISATIGYMLSPLHLCVILTREYFKAKFTGVYRYILPVPLIMLVAALLQAVFRGL